MAKWPRIYWVTVPAFVLEALALVGYATLNYDVVVDLAAAGFPPTASHYSLILLILSLQLLTCAVLLNRTGRWRWLVVVSVLFQLDAAATQGELWAELFDFYMSQLSGPFELGPYLRRQGYFVFQATVPILVVPALVLSGLSARRERRASAA